MRLTNGKPIFSEYKFLRLFLATLVKQGIAIIEKEELQKELYKYYQKEEYKILFEDIAVKKGIDYADLDLGESFQTALTLGLIQNISDAYRKIKSIIVLNDEEAEEVLKENEEARVIAMDSLVKEMINDKEKIKQEDQTEISEKGRQKVYTK